MNKEETIAAIQQGLLLCAIKEGHGWSSAFEERKNPRLIEVYLPDRFVQVLDGLLHLIQDKEEEADLAHIESALFYDLFFEGLKSIASKIDSGEFSIREFKEAARER